MDSWLSPQVVIALLAAVLSGIGGTAAVKGYLDRKKTAAEAKNLEITGDMTLGKGWQEYAEQQRNDKEALKKELLDQMKAQKEEHDRKIEELNKKFDQVITSKEEIISTLSAQNVELHTQNITLKTQNETLTTANATLTTQVESLLKELGRYQGMEGKVDAAKENLHTAVEAAAEDIMNPEKTHG